MQLPTERQCTVCHEIKPLSDFNRNKYKADGHKDQCRECEKVYRKEKAEGRKGSLANPARGPRPKLTKERLEELAPLLKRCRDLGITFDEAKNTALEAITQGVDVEEVETVFDINWLRNQLVYQIVHASLEGTRLKAAEAYAKLNQWLEASKKARPIKMPRMTDYSKDEPKEVERANDEEVASG